MEQKLKQRILQLYQQFKDEDAHKENRLEKWRNLEPESAELISIMIKAQQSKNVLELGTSNGFSTLWFADALKSSQGKLVSIEIEESRTQQAKAHLANFQLTENVELITADAGEFLTEAQPIYDLIFLDAERKNYVVYWPYLKNLLAKKGALLVVDNIISHHQEVEEFLSMIQSYSDFTTSVVNVGAGILLVTKQ
ncbi:class I SAM-dependent methyltransferase [Pedobacter sp.]|uniref:O-methyltransferase n=1 Tax=Pedobacter sp. TaxID=1411316 RepID=UPI0031D8AC03